MKKYLLVALVVILSLLGGGYFWFQQSKGSLDYLIPLVEKALNPDESDYHTEMENIQLKWDRFWTWPSIEVNHLTTRHRDLGLVLTIDHASAQLDLKSLFDRQLQVRSISILGGHLTTQNIPKDSEAPPWTRTFIAQTLSDQFQQFETLLNTYHGLKYVTVKNFKTDLNDPLDKAWSIGVADARIELTYNEQESFLKQIELNSFLAFDEQNPQLEINILKENVDQSPDWKINITQLETDFLNHFIENTPIHNTFVTAEIQTRIHEDRFINPQLELSSDSGTIQIDSTQQLLRYQQLHLHTLWEDHFALAQIDQSALILNNQQIQFSGTIKPFETEANISVQHADLDLPWVLQIWPHSMAQPGRNWIKEHVESIKPISSQIQVTPNSLKLKTQFNSLQTQPWKSTPTVSSGQGTLEFTHDSVNTQVEVQLNQATILNSNISKTTLAITDLREQPILFFEAHLAGSVHDALNIIKEDVYSTDSLPLKILQGQQKSTLKFQVPLSKDKITTADLRLSLITKLSQGQALLKIKELPVDTIQLKDIELEFQNERLKIQGLTLDHQQRIPFQYQMDLSPQTNKIPFLKFKLNTDHQYLNKFHSQEWVHGPLKFSGKLHLLNTAKNYYKLDLEGDLTQAQITFGSKIIKHSQSRSSKLKAQIKYRPEQIEIPSFNIQGRDLTVDFQAKIKDATQSISLNKFKVQTHLMAHEIQLTKTPSITSLKGNYLNPYQYFELDVLPSQQSEEDAPVDSQLTQLFDGRIDIKVNKIQLSSQGKLDEFYLTSHWKLGTVIDAKLKASFFQGIPLVGIFQKAAKHPTIKIETTDAGEFLRNFEYYNYMFGGRLDLNIIAHKGFLRPKYRAEYKIRNFRIAEAPTLSKIVALGSLVGIGDAFSGKGTKFHRAKGIADISLSRIKVYNTYIQGPSVSLYTSGEVQTETKSLRFEGNVVPFTSFNESLGLSFEVTDGPSLDEPDINVRRLVSIHPDIKKELKKLEMLERQH